MLPLALLIVGVVLAVEGVMLVGSELILMGVVLTVFRAVTLEAA